MHKLLTGIESIAIYEKAIESFDDVPQPICHFCKTETGYVEIEKSPALALILGLTKSPGFPIGNKYYVPIMRCYVCEAAYSGASGEVFMKKNLSNGTQEACRPDVYPKMKNFPENMQRVLNEAYLRGKEKFDRSIPPKKEKAGKNLMNRLNDEF